MDTDFANSLKMIEKKMKLRVSKFSNKESKYYHSLGDSLSKKIDRQRNQENIVKWFNG